MDRTFQVFVCCDHFRRLPQHFYMYSITFYGDFTLLYLHIVVLVVSVIKQDDTLSLTTLVIGSKTIVKCIVEAKYTFVFGNCHIRQTALIVNFL